MRYPAAQSGQMLVLDIDFHHSKSAKERIGCLVLSDLVSWILALYLGLDKIRTVVDDNWWTRVELGSLALLIQDLRPQLSLVSCSDTKAYTPLAFNG